jgi:hypothetical protein
VKEAQLEWLNGNFTGAETYATLQLNAEAIGSTRAYAHMADLEYFDIVGERP